LLLPRTPGHGQLIRARTSGVNVTDSAITIVYDGTIFTSQVSGGISRYFRRLIEEMARIRPNWQFELHIVDDGQRTALLPTGSNVRVVKRRHLRPGWFCVPANYASRQCKIRQARPAIVHTTLARPFRYAPCPLVTTIHDAVIEKFPEFYAQRSYARARRWWKWSAKRADAVLTVSRTSRSDILDIWSPPPSKVHVTYPGVEEVFRQADPVEASLVAAGFGIRRPFLLYVGHRGEHKNFQVLANAIRCSTLDSFDLVLVGGADEVPELDGWSGLEKKRLHHLRHVSDSQLHWLYAGAAALVFPSLSEGFGFPLVEAMSSGAPVVASNIPSSREVCGDAAEFYEPRDSCDCASAILRVQDRLRRRTLIGKGIERARLYTWDSCARQSLKVYEELIASEPRAFSGTRALAKE
jgi:glycosyltransferase involved in cell wall biosynthesis